MDANMDGALFVQREHVRSALPLLLLYWKSNTALKMSSTRVLNNQAPLHYSLENDLGSSYKQLLVRLEFENLVLYPKAAVTAA